MFRFAQVVLLSVACLGHGASGDEVAKSDLELFQGSWQPAFVRNPEGQVATSEELKSIRLVVKGSDFTFSNKELTISGTITLDSSKTPKAIDFLLANGKSPDEKFLGVYEIRGDRRLSCFALPKQARPREIRPADKGYLMFEWKPAAP